MEKYTKAPWLQGLSNESVIEDNPWVFLFYQEHRHKSKQGRRLKAGEKIIPTRNFYTKDCDVLLRISFTGGTTELVENRDRSKFIGYSQINH